MVEGLPFSYIEPTASMDANRSRVIGAVESFSLEPLFCVSV